MNKLTCFALLLLLLGQYRPATAQTCSAAFTYTTGSNKTVHFLAADSNGLTHHWLFGDGGTATGFAVSHTYAQPGQYTVRHATERPGTTCHDSAAILIVIPADSCAITARFQYHKDSLDCKKIHFINYSAPISPNVHFAWKFGDGSSSTDISPAHTYSQTGTYLVSLVSEAGTNCRQQYWDTVVVKCGDSCAIQSYFSWKADSLTAGKIYFTNLGRSAPGIHYTWNFGDSSAQSHDISPAHVYAHAGKYTVCLVAEQGSNCRKVSCLVVEVKEPGHCTTRAAFGYFRLAWMPLTVRFEALNQGDTAKYYWSFGDSSYGNGRLINHSYPHPGWYNTCLTVVKGNCSVISCQPVFVTPDSVLNLPQLVQAVPNPAINSVSINVTLDRTETVIIRILDGTGVIKAVFSKNGTTGNNRFTLPVERLSRGIYLVEIHTGTRQWFSRFQKG